MRSKKLSQQYMYTRAMRKRAKLLANKIKRILLGLKNLQHTTTRQQHCYHKSQSKMCIKKDKPKKGNKKKSRKQIITIHSHVLHVNVLYKKKKKQKQIFIDLYLECND
jgi:hypothetical protein